MGARFPEFGGTQFESMVSVDKVAPQVRLSEEQNQNQAVYSLILNRLLTQVHDISMGGLWQTLVEMILGENGACHVGFSLDLSEFDSLETVLFSENGGYVIAFEDEYKDRVISMAQQFKSEFYLIGRTTSELSISVNHSRYNMLFSVSDLVKSWKVGQR